MANNIGFNYNGGVKELKLGKSFNKGFQDESYHTIRYDFKPASVDTQKVGTLEVVAKEVTLTVPGAGSSQDAVFKGNKTLASKDCLLIIDHATGEVVLERISQHIRVKKTRTEGGNKKAMQRGMPQDSRSQKQSPSHINQSACSPHVARTSSPSHRSPSSKSPNHKNFISKPQNSTATPGSMPMLNFDEDNKSDSSSDSDSNSGSSSSSDTDSDSEPEPQPELPTQNYSANGQGSHLSAPSNHKSPSSILSDLELSEED